VQTDFTQRKSVVDNEAHKNREAKRAERAQRTTKKATGPARGIKFLDPEQRNQILEQWSQLEIRDFDMRTQTQFFTKANNVLDVIEEIVEYLDPECVAPTGDSEEAKDDKMEVPDTDLKADNNPDFDGEKLKFSYNITIPWELEEEEEEEEKEEADGPEKVTLKVVASVLKADDKTHCIDFRLKEYSIDGAAMSDRDNYQVRDRFLRHFHNLVAKKHVKRFNDAAADEVSTA